MKSKQASTSRWVPLILLAAALVVTARARAHTANICWRIEGNGSITIFAGSWHTPGELPHGGLILDGNTLSFTSFVDPLPGDVSACRGYCCGNDESTLIWQVVSVPDPGSGTHTVTTTADSCIERPAGPCADFAVDFTYPAPVDCNNNGIDDVCESGIDGDGDGFDDATCDNCPSLANPDQSDCQPNGIGDVWGLAISDGAAE